LGGILAAMGWAAAQGAARVLTAPVDTPFLPLDLVARLSAVAAPVVLAEASDGVHAACGLWSVDLRGPLAEALARGVRKVTAFTEAQGAVTVLFPETAPPGFFNVNSREDLAVAERFLGETHFGSD
jgi:molybdopterin-guanine dinucleotide biosynthesis protein A